MSKKPKLFKLILLGDQAVGKSSLLNRFTKNAFGGNLMGTAGIDISKKMMTINNEEVQVNIYDSAGHERFRNVAQGRATQVQGLLIVYDVTDNNSFKGAEDWLKSCFEMAKDSKVYILLGNKIDLQDDIKITTTQGQQLAQQYNAIFYETSAKTGDNVEKAFQEAVTILYNKKVNEEHPVAVNQNDSNNSSNKSNREKDNSCCSII